MLLAGCKRTIHYTLGGALYMKSGYIILVGTLIWWLSPLFFDNYWLFKFKTGPLLGAIVAIACLIWLSKKANRKYFLIFWSSYKFEFKIERFLSHIKKACYLFH